MVAKYSYLFLAQLDGELQSVQVHPVAVLEGRSRGIVIQQHLQLVGAARVVQQRRGEVLALLPQLLVLALELVLHEAQPEVNVKEIDGSAGIVETTHLRNSQESSKAVRMGSLEESAIKDGEAKAR